MSCYAEFAVRSVLIGVGATAAIDGWAWLLAQFGVPSLRMALLGRWLGHLAHGIWRHDSIASAPPIAGEARLGWAAHYAIGVSFTSPFFVVPGSRRRRNPAAPGNAFVHQAPRCRSGPSSLRKIAGPAAQVRQSTSRHACCSRSL